jgi:hypothetical protein
MLGNIAIRKKNCFKFFFQLKITSAEIRKQLKEEKKTFLMRSENSWSYKNLNLCNNRANFQSYFFANFWTRLAIDG